MLDENKLIKWIKEEIHGCSVRKETERENAMRELLLKIERGYFNVKAEYKEHLISPHLFDEEQ